MFCPFCFPPFYLSIILCLFNSFFIFSLSSFFNYPSLLYLYHLSSLCRFFSLHYHLIIILFIFSSISYLFLSFSLSICVIHLLYSSLLSSISIICLPHPPFPSISIFHLIYVSSPISVIYRIQSFLPFL